MKKWIFGAALAATLTQGMASTVVLYDQNFENPNGFVNDGGDVNIFRSVNELYGNQPTGFAFAQQFTVETLFVGGTQAWNGSGYKDPQGRAGRYTLGMLSSRQDDLLGLSFNVGTLRYLNFQLDVSSIDINGWGGPFVSQGAVPLFRVSLYDNPSGAVGLGGGTLLDQVEFSGLSAAAPNTFNWLDQTLALDAAGNTTGNVTMVIDLVSGGYAAMDNFRIAASSNPGDVGTVPEPGSLALALLAGAGAAAVARRRKA